MKLYSGEVALGVMAALSTLVLSWWVLSGDLGEDPDLVRTPVPMPLSVSPRPAPVVAAEEFQGLEPSRFPSEELRAARGGALSLEQSSGLDAQGLPRAWVVEVGVFSNAEAAEALLGRLRAGNYRAYSYPERNHAGERQFIVVVGPKIDHRRALDVRGKIKSDYQISATIRPYNPFKQR